MRMPNSEDMSQEQMNVYLTAPMKGSILVSGPPGTGKTVIAFQRARSAFDMSQKVKVCMFNKVLKSFTANVAEDDFDVRTFHSWVYGWWKRACYPQQPPVESHDKWQHDWPKMWSVLGTRQERGTLKLDRLNWGHVIIDEGQDFSPKMYTFFESVRKIYFEETPEEEKPAITVFADENQRLKERNSTIDQIRDALGISRDDGKRNYYLTRNYRNTRQVAELAAYFYTGLPTGIPKLPDKKGETPKLVFVTSSKSSIDYIVRYIQKYDNEEIGIIVQSNRTRRAIHETLQSRLTGFGKVKFQSYSSKESDNCPVEKMKFDQPGTVTLLNKESCKGLEFDSVFLPELQQITMTPSEIDTFKMEMYVMIARARKNVHLMINNSGSGTPAIMDYLPVKNGSLLEKQNA